MLLSVKSFWSIEQRDDKRFFVDRKLKRWTWTIFAFTGKTCQVAVSIGPVGLPPLDFFLWSGVKDRCYANIPLTNQALKTNIEQAIRKIEQEAVTEVLKN